MNVPDPFSSLRCSTCMLMLALSGCLDRFDADGTSTTSAATEVGDGQSSPAGATSPGSDDESLGGETGACASDQPGCPCDNGSCAAGLICVAGECVWPPPPDPGASTTGDESTGSFTTGGAGICYLNLDCAEWEVCNVYGYCVPAADAAYEVHVPSWSPGDCDGGPLDGVADVFWELRVDGRQIYESSWQQGVCPGSWGPGARGCVEPGEFDGPFLLSLYDQDVDIEQLQDRLWWDGVGDGVADPIHPSYLHAGEYDGPTGSGGHVRVEFEVVGGCG